MTSGADGTSVTRLALLGVASPLRLTRTRVFMVEVPRAEQVTLRVYAISGELVATLLDANLQPGTHRVTWDARTSTGGHVRSGVYFLKIRDAQEEMVRKVVVVP